VRLGLAKKKGFTVHLVFCAETIEEKKERRRTARPEVSQGKRAFVRIKKKEREFVVSR